jgi:hypothetical protein
MKEVQAFDQYDERQYLYAPTRRELAYPVDGRPRRRSGSPDASGATPSSGPRCDMGPSYWKCRCSDVAYSAPREEDLSGLRLRFLRLTFSVSRDEEYVHLQMIGCGATLDMGARSHNYLLLTLARHRLADRASGASDASCGWVYQDDLAHDCTMAAPRLNVDVFRIRKQFSVRGVVDANSIIERRPQTRQLRIGTEHVSIVCV